MRVLYGGSVTSKTVGDFVSEPGVDGVLVGGASTKPGEFLTIIKEVQKCHHIQATTVTFGKAKPEEQYVMTEETAFM